MPVRKIPKNHVSVTGRHATRKSTGRADFESPLENDYLTLLDFDPRVKNYEVQPVRVPVLGVPQGYVPDVLVHFHPTADGQPVPSELTEVKSDDDFARNNAKYAAKFAAAEAYQAAEIPTARSPPAELKGLFSTARAACDVESPHFKPISA